MTTIVFIPYGEFKEPFVWQGITYHPVASDTTEMGDVPQSYRDHLAAESEKATQPQGDIGAPIKGGK